MNILEISNVGTGRFDVAPNVLLVAIARFPAWPILKILLRPAALSFHADDFRVIHLHKTDDRFMRAAGDLVRASRIVDP